MSKTDFTVTIDCPNGVFTVQMDEATVWTVSNGDFMQQESTGVCKAFLRKCHSFCLDTLRMLSGTVSR
jgi:hypothetical protein